MAKTGIPVKSWKIRGVEVSVLDRDGKHEIWISDAGAQVMLSGGLNLFDSTLRASLLVDIIRGAVEGKKSGNTLAKDWVGGHMDAANPDR